MITKRGLWMIYLNYENKKVPKVKGRGLLVYLRYKQNAMQPLRSFRYKIKNCSVHGVLWHTS